jgi:integrase
MVRDYARITKRLCDMPTLGPAEIRDWLLAHYSADTTRRTLEKFSACCDWAITSGYITTNPYAPLRKQFRKRSGGSREGFLAAERDAILDAIATDRYSDGKYTRYRQSFYLPFLQFLFWTGCRLEEASALRWEHIAKDCATISFTEALPADTRILGDIKTHRHRDFPCNARLVKLLQSQPRGDGYVFPSQGGKGTAISSQNLLNRTWKPVVSALAADGTIRKYLPTKHTRHTFITLALEAGMDPKDVARLVGNTAEVIYKHYAAPAPVIVVPEF